MSRFCVWILLLAFEVALAMSNNCDLFVDSDGSTVLECHQRIFQTSIDAKEVELSGAKVLHIKCGGKVFQESWLRSLKRNATSNLTKVIIEFCEIGQAHLLAAGNQNLTNNYASLAHLEHLVMVNNNLWSLPRQILCSFDHLKQLDLSSNHILEVGDIGMTSNLCEKINVEEIDLSDNFISSLGPEAFSYSPMVKKICLAGNILSVLSSDSFKRLTELRDLDLSNNQLSELTLGTFQDNANLENLSLQNNSLRIIGKDIFKGLSNLKYLNLSHNHLLSSKSFESLTQLQVLDISFNKLTEIRDDFFSNLTSLKEIYLNNNLIHSIGQESFVFAINLQTIDLSFNKLSSLSKVFEKTLKLMTLKLDNNRIEDLEHFLLPCGSLVELSLHENQLTSVPNFVKVCKQVQVLDLSGNRIKSLANAAFFGIDNLVSLNLSGNQLESLANETFTNISSQLKSLNLAHNNLKTIDRLTFVGLRELSNLRLDANQLSELNGLLSHLTNLQHLNVSDNNLEWFDYAFIPNTLVWLDISHNGIGSLGNFYNLENFRLETLIAGHNSILKLEPGSLLRSLVQAKLDHNLISRVEAGTFAKMSNLHVANLQHNQIHHLEPEALESSPDNIQGRPYVYISDNPLECDCKLEWLLSINDNSLDNNVIVPDLSAVICYEEDAHLDQSVEAKLLVKSSPGDFLCQYDTHCFEMCLCCDFYACDCRMQCPFGCECEHNADWSVNTVTCSERNHTYVPALIPMDTTTLRLDGNRLHHVDQQYLLGRHKIQQLYLNASHVSILSENAFIGLTGLKILHLEDNQLGQLQGREFSDLHQLRELYLHNNALTYIHEMTFQQLKALEILRLDGNLLSVFPVWKLSDSNQLKTIFLSQNTWSCDCEFVAPFNQFLESHHQIIPDYQNISCASNDIIPIGMHKKGICSNENGKPERSGLSMAVVFAISGVIVFLFIISLLATCVYWKASKMNSSPDISRGDISVDQYSETTGISTAKESSANLFDAYIMYSEKESEFVHHTLAPTLENGTGSYRLCLHQRDFPADTTVFDSISVAVNASKTVIMVLTDSFLQSEWHQNRSALYSSLFSNDIYREKLVILMISDLSCDFSLAPDLHFLTQTCPTIRWGAPGYLNSLRFVLPEPALLTFQRNITMKSLSRKQDNVKVSRFSNYGGAKQDFAIYSSCSSDHTYHSIPDNIYCNLEQNSTLAYANLGSKPTATRNDRTLISPIEPQFNFPHSIYSSSNGGQLLSPDISKAYIV